MTKKKTPVQPADALLHDLRYLIEETRSTVATTVNAALTMLYWRVGNRINAEILQGGRADYGQEIVATLSQQLSREYGNGFSYSALTPDLVFRDPYFLDFLGLKDAYREKDLEAAILRELESFIMELGAGFTFVARQKRIIVDGEDFYIDLLFYHRDLRRLVVIELKLDKFRPEHKGQLELYLRWLDRYERKQGEESPLGIILCAGKNDERVELLELGASGIHVAEYLTILPPKELLQKKLHAAIDRSRKQFDNQLQIDNGEQNS
jgi:predicted nuclease of restriction endonuclease-like (RecB) superfamily